MDADGWRVFAGIRNEEDADSLREAGSQRLTPVMLDITNSEQIAAAAKQVADEVGEAGLDGLVNNAGVTFVCPMEALPVEEFRRMLDINLIGQVEVTQALLPLLRRSAGRVVFVGSISGRVIPPFLGAYGASKSGLGLVGDAFRQELRRWNISVSIVEPGAIETPIWERAEEDLDRILRQDPADLNKLYGKAIAAFRDLAERMTVHRIPPGKVASSIAHALTAPRPRTRYLVGLDARGQAFSRWFFSDRFLDWFSARMLGISARRPLKASGALDL